LAKKNVLVKRMNTVETLGAANVVCSDKTGTLTMNQMTVMNMWFDQSFLPAKSTMELGNQFIHSKTYLTLFRVASLCNRAYFDKPADPEHEEGLEERRRSLEREGFTDVRPSMERARGPRPSIELTDDNKFEVRLQRGGNNRGPTFRPSMDGRAEGRPSLEAGRTEGRPSMEGRYEAGRPSLDARGKQSLELINFVNEARIETAGKVIVGDASETALFRYTSTFTDVDAIRTRFPKLFEIPFNSTNKWQLSIHDTRNAKKKHLLVIKGAPERILLKCKKALINGRKIVIDDAFREQYDRAYKTFGGAGERVLGFAQKKFLPEPHVKYDELHPNFPTEDYTFVGLISLEDPPRDGVPEAINTCHEAGIKVIMVTGDHPFTAEAIARKVGIIGAERTRDEVAKLRNCSPKDVQNDEFGAVVVPGSEIDDLTEEDWDNILSKPEIVFARTSPQQKLEIVKNNQRRGNVVAVTGDGVNDSPALKQADLGIAMGISGSDVAREAAEVVLLDDNFPSIIVGIREGRVIYDNLKKTIAYSLTHLTPEIVPVLCTLAFGIPIALNSILILLIDCGTEMAPAISFAYETPEGDIMKRKPRDVKREHLVNLPLLLYSYLQAGVVTTGLCFLTYFLIFMKYGIPASALPFSSDKHWINSGAEDFVVGDVTFTPAQQAAILAEVQSGYWITLVMCQFWHVWMCKTRIISLFKHNMRNWTMTMGVIIEACLVVIIVYVPFLHFPFGTANVDGYYWLVNLGMVVLIWTWAEARKAVTRKYPQSKFNKAFAW
jgi:sodium/potassium-transporting ATPase subunit alpha